ncbi:hypothetical protein [Shewanella sp. Isolate11]|uniref:hypothetical protein n=1 Tax=Shewanella sp. Isolate11 TaxID=2908530 RepID=UPI001EFD94EB|nr:hypothetical protein [Shewanella sp. Isolate11]MCG9696037.1 hypothetical protein [Shewanella sp. Isolate11]
MGLPHSLSQHNTKWLIACSISAMALLSYSAFAQLADSEHASKYESKHGSEHKADAAETRSDDSISCHSTLSATQYQASYLITSTSKQAPSHNAVNLTLSRFNDSIIYQHTAETLASENAPNQQVATSLEAWNKSGEYVRYFPAEKRSISYQRGDLLALNIHTDVDKQFHLISQAERNQFTQKRIEQGQCFSEQELQNHQGQPRVNVTWLTEMSLPKSITLHHGEQVIHYQLTQLVPFSQSDFKQLTSGYRDMDFADVGDSESDPFIAKMITQGFIQHGSSGFYSADGSSLEGGNHGHHH